MKKIATKLITISSQLLMVALFMVFFFAGTKTNDKSLTVYNDNFSKKLDKYLENDDILDLRAGFYEKFYVIKKPYKTLKFIKDGKVVSHFAKAYRGEILKIIAQNDIKTFEDFMNLELKNLKLKEIKEQKLKTEIVYSII